MYLNCISTSVATVLKCMTWLYPYVPTLVFGDEFLAQGLHLKSHQRMLQADIDRFSFVSQGPRQTLKRPAESMLSPSDAQAFIALAGAPTHQISKRMKKGHPKKVVCTNNVKEPVFKVSLSLQEGPVIIERASLRETNTVAPEIEDQSPATICTDNDAQPLATNTQSEVQMCFHSCMYEEQFTNPAHYAYSGQFHQSQVIQYLEPSLRPRDCGPADEVVTVTYADWPLQDWSYNNMQWVCNEAKLGWNWLFWVCKLDAVLMRMSLKALTKNNTFFEKMLRNDLATDFLPKCFLFLFSVLQYFSVFF